MTEEETLTTKGKLTGFMRRLYLDPKMRGVVAGSIAALGVPGSPALSAVGAGFSFLDNFLVAQLSQAESNRVYLSDRFEARTEVLYDRGRLDEEAFGDPDYKGLAFQGAIFAAQETSEEKIDLIAAILAGAASKDRPAEMNMRAVLGSISFLTIEEIRLARQFYEGDEILERGYSVIDGVSMPNWGPDTGLYVQRLATAGLIVRRSDPGPYSRFSGPGGRYHVTSTFQRLMELLRQTEPLS